jgi:uncharacterized iron-regulated membrane protein
LLALLLSGLWAWWPRGSLAKALRFKRHAPPTRRLRDWHKLSGLAGMILLLLLTVTGVMLELPEKSDAVLGSVGLPVAPMEHVHVTPLVAPQITPATAMAAARSALPGARIAWIETPSAAGGLYRLRMQVPGDPSFRFPHSFVWVDAADGRVREVDDLREAAPGNAINAWVHPLHDGSAFGLAGRILTAIAGLLPLILFITGWRRWRLHRAWIRPASRT